jgi:hypothetical protein
MKKRDILYELYKNLITEKEAYIFYNQLIGIGTTNIADFMMLDMRTEWTAFRMDDIPLTIIAQWRYEGWPTHCAICERDLNIKKGWWRPLKQEYIKGKLRNNVMVHWDCYSKNKL